MQATCLTKYQCSKCLSSCLSLFHLSICPWMCLIGLSLTSLSSSFNGFSGRISEPADLGARIDKDLFPEGSVGDQDLLVQVRIVDQSFGLWGENRYILKQTFYESNRHFMKIIPYRIQYDFRYRYGEDFGWKNHSVTLTDWSA